MVNSKVVLIVDEDKINRNVLAKILKDEYTIILAQNGTEALKILKTNYKRIAAIIIDLEMKTMDGYELLKEIHEASDYSKIPIIASNHLGSEEQEEKALMLGAHDFIVKPYNAQIIKRRIANTIELMDAVKVVNLVIKDDLTPLHNKQYFMTETREVFIDRADEEFDVICLDIDQFKMVNDSYGMATGDKVLYKAGELIAAAFGEDSICARFTADKFFITLKHQSLSYTTVIEKLTNDLNKYVSKIGVKNKIKICCGVYYIHDKTIPIAAMCDRAELATENIKGKYGQVIAFYEDEIRQQMHNTLAITNMMEFALKNEEFQIFYQPKYELASECVAGAEALVRWKNYELGFMSPGSFIPLFERNGFITQLDMFVWETVCKDMSEWISRGNKPFAVSMNVSRADIYNPNLVKVLCDLSDKYKLDRKFLHLEITESAYTDSPEQIIKIVTQLRSRGFPIEMDDFGSGYSSLNMLAEIPIDVLKLDMGFVRNELQKPNGKGILGFVISLAKWLNLAVVAEGVETPEQIRILNSMECNYVQGFYFAKPLCKEDFFALMGEGKVKEMYLTSSSVTSIDRNQIAITKATGERKGTMLVVDDIEISRKIIIDLFHNEYDIAEAVDGQQAWEYIQENFENISVIMMDLLMPIMDGYQLLKLIRQDDRTKDIPVVVTSLGEEASEERALAIGADDFVSKPYNMTVLKHRVSNVLINSRIKRIEREHQQNKLALEAELAVNKDVLTGLYTRKVIESKVNDFFADKADGEAVFLMLDLDNFKEVNDTYGHIKGDETLKKVSDILASSFRDEDVICRMGGDEFSVFIPHLIERNSLEAKLNRLCECLDFMVESIRITCSIGACVSPEYGQDYQTLYNNADMALLTSKRFGKNQFQIYNGQSVLPSFVFYRNIDCLLDEFTDAIFVIAKDTYEMLYINKNACELFNVEKRNCIGKKCFENFHQKNNICVHCISNDEISEEQFLEAPFIINGQSYILKIKLINWSGVPARVHYIQRELPYFEKSLPDSDDDSSIKK